MEIEASFKPSYVTSCTFMVLETAKIKQWQNVAMLFVISVD